jgi:hypothetical protein
MTRRQKTTFTPHVDGLERREVLSNVVDFTIPFVTPPPGVNKSAIDFTSNRFNQVWKSLNAVERNFVKTGNVANVEAQLTKIAGNVPYGRVLLNTWLSTVESGVAANTSPIDVLHRLEANLISYLETNDGIALNVQKSHVGWFTDGLLIYNSRVGHRPPPSQQIVIGVPPM